MKKRITLKQIDDIFKKYGDLNINVSTPYGYKKINGSDITAVNSKIIKLTLDDGKFIEGSPDHKVKTPNGSFVELKKLGVGQKVQTISGNIVIDSLEVLPYTEDLYDIEVDNIHQYYSNGIVSHNSILAMDTLLFLLFNTTSKGSTAIKMFNAFRPECDNVRVKGEIMIDGVDYIIERTVSRKAKRDGSGYTTKTDLTFAKVMADGTIQNLEGEQRRETDEMIRKSIGSVDDFLLTIIADADNLEDIIHTKPTEKGRILSRFIGLEILEDKENIVKEMKSKWSKGLKSDQYNITQLTVDNTKLEETILLKTQEIIDTETEIELTTIDLTKTRTKKDGLLERKISIDSDIISLRPEDIQNEIDRITKEGIVRKENYDKAKADFSLMSEITYDEELHNNLIKEERTISLDMSTCKSDITRTEKLIKTLEEGKFCPTCKQALADVDHSDEINENKTLVLVLRDRIKSLDERLDVVVKDINDLNNIKKQVSEYDRMSLTVDKLELDLNRLRLDLREKKDLKTKYEQNIDNINTNKELDTQILGYSSKISGLEHKEKELIKQKERLTNEIENLNISINKNNELIKTIKVEEEIKVVFDIYTKMIGKNGISKLIMKVVTPLINSELERLLVDTANFKLIVDINDKNEVEFLVVKDGMDGDVVTYPISEGSGFEKTVSSLALRCVMTKISCLPKPNLIVMDEVFGKVAMENLELVGEFFQKCSEMFPNIFLITHIPQVKDWANKIITVNKVDNISSLTLN